MKNRFLVAFLCSYLLLASGCQRDDICPATTNTTPLLRISFFDVVEPDIPKPAVNLRVIAAGYDVIIVNRQSVTEISIPLRTDVDITEYDFILNAPVITEGGPPTDANSNTDRIEFTYARDEEYINRACSFKVNFLDLDATVQPDDNRWINSLIIAEDNIENETDTHIFIYH